MGADDVPSADGGHPASPDDERASLTASVHSVHCSSRGATSADVAHALDADDVVVGVMGDGEGDDAKQAYDRKIAEVMSDAGCSSSEEDEEDDSPASIQPVIPTELPVGPAGVTSPEFAHVVANTSGVEWKGIALAAGLASFEGDWQPQLPHAKEDAALVSETCHSLGFNSVVDLTNNKVYNTQRIGSHRCGQLSYWELQTHFRNAAQIAGDGVLLFYMSTRAGFSSAEMKKSGGPPDALCTYDSDSLIKLDDFVRKIASLVTPNVTTIVVLDLSVPQQYDMTRLPNLAALCPPRFSVMVSLTPIEAPIFTPKFLQAITQPPPPGSESGGMTLKDVAWSEHISSELSRVAEACCRAEEERGVSPAARRWTLPQWIPNTAACSLDDSSMNTTIGNPVAVGLVHISDDTKLLVSLTKRITTTPDNLVKMFEKLRVIESLLGPGSGDAIVSMQPLQGVVVSQASSTHHKAWEAFRSLHSLSTAEMQKCDKDKETAGSNKMVTYFKLGDVYTPNSRAEHEWFSLERNYTSITARGGDLFFGSDPQAGLAIDALSTEQACKISGLSLRVEPTFKASVASHVKLVAESRMPPSSTSLLGGEGGVFEMKVHKIYQLLNPKTTSVRYFADTEYQRRQQLRTKVACKMDLTRAIGANQNGMVEPDAANRGFSQWLQVSQDAQIEAAIRIQSIFRMYCVRKMVLQLQWQMGDRDTPRDGIEIRRAVRQWLLACSRHCEWRPLSSSITCFVSSGLPPRGAGTAYSYDQLMGWMAKYNRLRADLVGQIARELDLDRTVMGGVNLIRVEGVSGGPPSHQFVVKLRAVAEEASDGMHVSAETRQALEEMAERIANVMRFQLKEAFGVTEVVVQSEKTVRGMEHVDVRNATCEQAIRAVLSGKADGDRSKDAALPPSIRRTLESGLDEGRSATDHIIYALLADDECSVPMGWKRHVLEAPLLPGNAFCVKPREGTPLFEALKMTDEQKARSREFMDLRVVHDIFSIARLRGDKKLVYEAPGVRQLEKTPLIVYSRYWADKGYYDEVQEYSAFAEAERLKLMMHTVRNRRELKMMYRVSLLRGLKDLLFDVTRGCCLKFCWMLSVMAVAVYSVLIYLLPQWCANILALFYLSDMSQLSLEAIITWLLIFLLLLLGGLFLGGACVGYVKGNFSYKVRTLFIYISAKYSRLLSAELVYNIREKDIRLAVTLLFSTMPRLIMSFILVTTSIITLFAISVQIGLICLIYLVLKALLHAAYDKFMTRHMTAITNIEKEEQLRWVVLRGPQGAAGHVVAQAADDHQMRLCLFAREKRLVNTNNMTVHTLTAVVDWLMMFSLPAFLLFVGANQVAEYPKDGRQMAKQVEQLPLVFFYYALLLASWRMGLRAMVQLVEYRPNILRLLTVLRHVHLTEEEEADMKKLLSLGNDDTELAERLRVTSEGGPTAPAPGHDSVSGGEEVEMVAVPPSAEGDEGGERRGPQVAAGGVALRERGGWYKKRMLLEFDWFNALMDQHPMSSILIYLCLMAWLVFIACVAIFLGTSWASECETVHATCKILDTDVIHPEKLLMPQRATGLGRCQLMQPIAYSLAKCASNLQHFTQARGLLKPGQQSMTVSVEYNTWQAGTIGFYHPFKWNATHAGACPTDDEPWSAFKTIRLSDINDEEKLEETFDPHYCGVTYSEP